MSSAGPTRCMSIYRSHGSRVLSVLFEGRWLNPNQLQCVSERLQVVGTTLRQVTAAACKELWMLTFLVITFHKTL